MASNDSNEVQDSILQNTSQSQSHHNNITEIMMRLRQRKEREARRDAENRIRNFNYAKSIGSNNADGKEEEEIQPLSSVAQRYLGSLAGNGDVLDDDDGDDAACQSNSDINVQEQTIDAVPDNSGGNDAAAAEVDVDNTIASKTAVSSTNRMQNGGDDKNGSAMIVEDMNAESDNDDGEVHAMSDSSTSDDIKSPSEDDDRSKSNDHNNEETSNDGMSTTCIDGEEEPDEIQDEDQTEYCGTVVAGALSQQTNKFSDQSGHAIVDEESQCTDTTPVPQNNDTPPGQSLEREDLPYEDETVGRTNQRRKLMFILCALAVTTAVVAGMGVGVDRGLNHIDKASTLIIPVPTQSPTSEPSLSVPPSDFPSLSPSESPSTTPSAPPSISTMPSISPTTTMPPTLSAAPSSQPSSQPSSEPTSSPSISSAPSDAPSVSPSISTMPSASPSATPTGSPSATPSSFPTSSPSSAPSVSSQPSSMPSLEIEPFRTMLKKASPKSAERLHRERAYQYKMMMWVYYETDYDNYTDEERLQLWALGCFFEATLGVHWDDNTNWMEISHNITACDWYGLTCNERGMVTRIELAQNHVQRNIPVEFKVLPSLQYLGLAENSIGRLDPMLFEMYTLEVIDLDGNGIETIPDEIPIRNQVKELYLAGNRIREIPESILMLSKLEVLWLWTNLLEDTLPEFMSKMSNLVELDLEDNFLSGDLWPAAEMQSLQHLYVFDNIMGGEITSGFLGGNITYADGDLESSPVLKRSTLKSLDMSTNYYYGTIPTKLTTMVNMEELYLEDNELSGIIPPEIFNLGNLNTLFLGTNYLSSVIPSEISNARSLKSFHAENNYRESDSGWIESKGIYGQLPATMMNLNQLEELVLDNNYVEGTLMSELGTLEHLSKLRLVLNMLEGPIPSSVQNLAKLKDLQLWGNYMTGSLPNFLSLELERLQLHDNSFIGTIPTDWAQCRNLTVLDVSYNDLTGPIPNEFGNLANLEEFYTEHNVLYGFMPEEVCLLRSESLDELSANCDVPRENTLRPTRKPTTWSEGFVRHHRNLQKEKEKEKEKPPDLLITSSPSESPVTSLPTETPSLLQSLPNALGTNSPTGRPSLLPSIQVQIDPTITASPTSNPSDYVMTNSPTDGPSLLPSSQLTEPPSSQAPTFPPSFTPSMALSHPPSFTPSKAHSQSPSPNPSISMRPMSSPTSDPTLSIIPTFAPTRRPSKSPTKPPTESPTFPPSPKPTKSPTKSPTDEPSISIPPSAAPTVEYFWVCTCCTYCRIDSDIHPTMKPTRRPTPRPTRSPSPTWVEAESPTRPSVWWNKRVNELT